MSFTRLRNDVFLKTTEIHVLAMDSQYKIDSDKKEGYLRKWTNYVSHYQRRWFVYENGHLTYYVNPSEVGHVARASLKLLSCKIRFTPNFGFNILKNNRTIFALRAENRKDFDEWIQVIENGIIKCDQATDSGSQLQRISSSVSSQTFLCTFEDFLINAAMVSENCSQMVYLVEDVEKILEQDFGKESNNSAIRDKLGSLSAFRELTAKIVQSVEQLVKKSELLTEFAADPKALNSHCANRPKMSRLSNPEIEENIIEDDIESKNHSSHSNDELEFYDAVVDDKKLELPPSHSSRRGNKSTSLANIQFQSKPIQHVRSVSDMPRMSSRTSHTHRTVIPPQPAVKLNLWSLIRTMIGKDLSRIALPVYFNEPLSMLQRVTESLEYSHLLDKASCLECPAMQLCYVVAFTISNYCSTAFRTNKPFNPLLGETFECDRMDDFGWRCICEQVSHHPPVCALHAEGRGWVLWETFDVKSKFMAKYLEIHPLGLSQLVFTRTGFRYSWNKVTTTVNNIVIGTLWIDHFGTLTVRNNTTGHYATIEFFPYSRFNSTNHKKVSGNVYDASNQWLYTLNGHWDKLLDCSKIVSKSDGVEMTSRREILWTANRLPLGAEKMYNFSEFACSLNEPDEFVAPTDCRRRPDQRAMEQGDFDHANSLKSKLEEAQRQRRKRIIQEAVNEVN